MTIGDNLEKIKYNNKSLNIVELEKFLNKLFKDATLFNNLYFYYINKNEEHSASLNLSLSREQFGKIRGIEYMLNCFGYDVLYDTYSNSENKITIKKKYKFC